MSTIVASTPTNANATSASSQRKLDRCQNGNLVAVYADTTTNGVLRYSSDDGKTWASAAPDVAGFTNGSMFVDIDDYVHIVWKQSGTGGSRTDGFVYYMRGTPNSDRTAWSWSAVTAAHAATGYDYCDVVAHREGTGWVAHTVVSYNDGTSAAYPGAFYRSITITSGGVFTLNGQTVLGQNYAASTSSNHSYPSLDFNHTGDGKSVAGATPHLYASWSASVAGSGKGIRFKKATYSAGAWTWGTEREIDNAHYSDDPGVYVNCLFDGTVVVLVGGSLNNGTQRDTFIWERDAADTTTTTKYFNLAQANADKMLYGSATYDQYRNVYIISVDVGATPALTVWAWSRSSGSMTRTSMNTTAGVKFVSARRGAGRYIDYLFMTGSSSPYTVNLERTYVALLTGGGYG